ncbi:MAG: HD domain-containing protein [Lewinellaceae bacterium]|nr:HD domain-containing protein [Lewinellaceae bacterium]
MKLPLDDPSALEAFLRPESDLERHLLTFPEFRRGLLWGEPRFGHPEGKIVLHIREVLDNVDLIQGLTKVQRQQLRLITLVHDTFKYAEDRSRPRDWSKHHGQLARRFLKKYTNDRAVLDIVETHDDAYYAWLAQKHEEFGAENPHKSLDALLLRVGYCRQMYYLFFKCDTQTGDKTQAPLKWFERTAPGIAPVSIREAIW